MRRGKYIVLEGGEGAGKGTALDLVKAELANHGITVQTLVEPGGDRLGQGLRSILKGWPDDPVVQAVFGQEPVEIEPLTELFLFNAARVQALRQAEEWLGQGVWVAADRSFVSTLAYQGHGRQLPLEAVRSVCQVAISACLPDLVVVLDVPYEVSVARQRQRGTTDRIEQGGEVFHQRVLAGYRLEAVAAGLPVVDASGTVDEVFRAVWQHVQPLVEEYVHG